MKSLKAIIVDDERLARANLRKLLEGFPTIRIVGEAGSCDSAAEIIGLLNPDLIFLDIQLRGETGFDLLERINKSVKIIFVTAYDEFALRAFEINAIDYLLKPVNPVRLEKTIERLFQKANLESQEVKCFDYNDSIYVQINNFSSKFVKIRNIAYLESAGNYSKVVSLDGKYCLVLKTLKQWESELPKNNFARIHRSSIINIEQIDRIDIDSLKHHKLFLKNFSNSFEISRRYVKNLKYAYPLI